MNIEVQVDSLYRRIFSMGEGLDFAKIVIKKVNHLVNS